MVYYVYQVLCYIIMCILLYLYHNILSIMSNLYIIFNIPIL
jgi:hypothetical protein